MNDRAKSGFLRSKRLIVGLLIVLVVAIGLYVSKRGSVSESGPVLVNEPRSVTILSGSSKPSTSEAEKKEIGPFEGMSADASETLRDLLNTEYCYSRDGQAVMENPNAWTQEAFDKEMEKATRRMELLSGQLSESADGDHQFAAAIIGMSLDGRNKFFEKANSIDPDNRVYRFLHATECAQGEMDCDNDKVLSELVRVDPDNTEALMLRALVRFSANQTDLALNDLRYASTLPATRTYFADVVLTLERALSATGMGFSESSYAAFGLSAASGGPYSDLSLMCTKMGEADESWRRACMQYFERVEQQADTRLVYAIALGSLNAISQYSVDSAKREAIAARYAAYRERDRKRVREVMKSDFDDEFYLYESPRVFNDYLNHMKAHGERSAQQYYEEEVKRLKANGWLSPCELKSRIEASAE
ncbi:MAG: hypothetical protein AAF385_08860 [Pseudomonadota bacterium]